MKKFDEQYRTLIESVGGDNTEVLKTLSSVLANAAALETKLKTYNYPLDDWAVASLAKASQMFNDVREDCEFKCKAMDQEFAVQTPDPAAEVGPEVGATTGPSDVYIATDPQSVNPGADPGVEQSALRLRGRP